MLGNKFYVFVESAWQEVEMQGVFDTEAEAIDFCKQSAGEAEYHFSVVQGADEADAWLRKANMPSTNAEMRNSIISWVEAGMKPYKHSTFE